ncbi:MAG: hypothetical protein FWC41_12840 [Firmicutes bacterium]|nr:hypothetical protein [Bacillota bacterium]
MTIKEAVIKSMEDLVIPTNSVEITNHILKNKYAKFEGDTPHRTVAAQCGDYIRIGDSRVRRIKEKATYLYYLTKNEQTLDVEKFEEIHEELIKKNTKKEKVITFSERDLHKLLSSFLKTSGIYTKTIFHEQSNGKDSNQMWTHPDMVGIRFLKLQNKTSQNFLKAINQIDTFKMSSYEIKRELNSDSELKKAFFQAVSNSSWANYGYLVAFEISDTLSDEMARLNQSFGIGIIKLNANPYQSKILYQAKYKELDFKTIDKLCKINKEFEKFIEQTEKLMTAEERFYELAEMELEKFCDSYLENDTDVQRYCKEKNIPIDEE